MKSSCLVCGCSHRYALERVTVCRAHRQMIMGNGKTEDDHLYNRCNGGAKAPLDANDHARRTALQRRTTIANPTGCPLRQYAAFVHAWSQYTRLGLIAKHALLFTKEAETAAKRLEWISDYLAFEHGDNWHNQLPRLGDDDYD
jgi:hypothetical protein